MTKGASSSNPTIANEADGISSAAGTPQGNCPAVGIDQMSPEDAARVKREYVLTELVETERVYVQDLASVVDGYIANLSNMELPEDLQGKDKIIFANIAQILDFHKTIFLKEIEKSLVDYEAAGNAFVKYERRLNTHGRIRVVEIRMELFIIKYGNSISSNKQIGPRNTTSFLTT